MNKHVQGLGVYVLVVLSGCHLALPLAGQPDNRDAGGQAVAPDTGPDQHTTTDTPPGVDVGVDMLPLLDTVEISDVELVPSCVERYGSISSFELCSETAGECTFGYHVSGNASCEELCSKHGGLCVAAYDAGDKPYCQDVKSQIPCKDDHSDSVCTCTKPQVRSS